MSKKLPRATFSSALPGQDYPFKIILRGADVLDLDTFSFIFKSAGVKHEVNVDAVFAPADVGAVPPIVASKTLSGFVPFRVTRRWHKSVTWILATRATEKVNGLIGGTFGVESEFEGML